MKRLLLISLICILSFSGCSNKVGVSETNMLDKEKNIVITEELKREIDEYIDSIYEPGGVLIPSFDDINLADEDWYWKCAKIKKDLSDIATKEEIEAKVKNILGDKAKRELPKDGVEGEFKPAGDGYIVEIYGGWEESYDYIIDSIKASEGKIIVEIVEYKHSDFEHDATEVSLSNMNTNEIVTKFDLTSSTYLQNKQKAKDFVTANKDKFTKAIITLEKDEQTNNLYIVALERKAIVNEMKSEVKNTDNEFANAYIKKIEEIEKEDESEFYRLMQARKEMNGMKIPKYVNKLKYDLAYFDDDDIPELVVGENGYWVSMYTYKNGNIYEIIEHAAYGVGGCVEYQYALKSGVLKYIGHDTTEAYTKTEEYDIECVIVNKQNEVNNEEFVLKGEQTAEEIIKELKNIK